MRDMQIAYMHVAHMSIQCCLFVNAACFSRSFGSEEVGSGMSIDLFRASRTCRSLKTAGRLRSYLNRY